MVKRSSSARGTFVDEFAGDAFATALVVAGNADVDLTEFNAMLAEYQQAMSDQLAKGEFADVEFIVEGFEKASAALASGDFDIVFLSHHGSTVTIEAKTKPAAKPELPHWPFFSVEPQQLRQFMAETGTEKQVIEVAEVLTKKFQGLPSWVSIQSDPEEGRPHLSVRMRTTLDVTEAYERYQQFLESYWLDKDYDKIVVDLEFV
jgi:hypothetical protein